MWRIGIHDLLHKRGSVLGYLVLSRRWSRPWIRAPVIIGEDTEACSCKNGLFVPGLPLRNLDHQGLKFGGVQVGTEPPV